MSEDSGLQKITNYVEKVQNAFQSAERVVKSFSIGIEAIQKVAGAATSGFDLIMNGMEALCQYDERVAGGWEKITTGIQDSLLAPIAQQALPMLDMLQSALNQALSGEGVDPAGLTETIGQFMASSLASLAEQLPMLLEFGMVVLQSLLTGILQNLPMVLETGIQLLVQLMTGIATMLPELIPMAIECLLTLVTTLLDNLDLLIDAAIDLMIGLALGLIQAIPVLIEKIPIIIQKLLEAFISNLPRLLEMGLQIIVQLALGLVKAVPSLLSTAGTLISQLMEFFGQIPKKIINIGGDIVRGLWDGIVGCASWLWDKLMGFANTIIDKVKGFFKIQSPSKVFSDEIGKYLALGMGEGFEKNIDSVYDDMQSSIAFEMQRLHANLSSTANVHHKLTAMIQMQGGDILMDSEKVGRLVTPSVSKTLMMAGV